MSIIVQQFIRVRWVLDKKMYSNDNNFDKNSPNCATIFAKGSITFSTNLDLLILKILWNHWKLKNWLIHIYILCIYLKPKKKRILFINIILLTIQDTYINRKVTISTLFIRQFNRFFWSFYSLFYIFAR